MPSTAPPNLRDARDTDLPGLLALEAMFPGDRLSARQFRRHLASPRARLRVAQVEGRVVGYALIFLREGSAIARLYSLAVDPACRGHGIGAALLADAQHQAAVAGRHRLRLEVRADNDAAIALYERARFVQFGRHASYYEDGCDALRLERVLDRKAVS